MRIKELLTKIQSVLPIIFQIDERLERIETSITEQNELLTALLKSYQLNRDMDIKLLQPTTPTRKRAK